MSDTNLGFIISISCPLILTYHTPLHRHSPPILRGGLPPSESFPTDEEHRRYLDEYNTR